MDALQKANRADVFQWHSQLAQSLGAVNLSQGVPEPLLDVELNSALLESVAAGWGYSDPRGASELRSEIRDIFKLDSIDEVLITSGCTESLYVGLRSIPAEYGDAVAFFEPFYPYYPGLTSLAGRRPVPIPFEWNGSVPQPDWEAVEASMKRGVRIFILNSPHNPTGWVMDDDGLGILEALSRKYRVAIVVDDAYRGFVYDSKAIGALDKLKSAIPTCLIAGAVSKLLSAPGLRVGWLIGGREELASAHAIHMHTSYCQPLPLQLTVVRVLKARGHLCSLVDRYRRKRDNLFDALSRLGLTCTLPGGGHFILADYSALNTDLSSGAFAVEFAKTYGVMPLPVTPFYADASADRRLLRFSFAVSPSLLEQAVSRLTLPFRSMQ